MGKSFIYLFICLVEGLCVLAGQFFFLNSLVQSRISCMEVIAFL